MEYRKIAEPAFYGKVYLMNKFTLKATFLLALAFVLLGTSSCHSSRLKLDKWFFATFGKTVFNSARETTIKNIQLDYQGLDQTLLIVKGSALLSEIDKDKTFLVLSDNEANVIVKLTLIPSFHPESFKVDEGRINVQILGSLDRTDKSIPVILAETIRQSPVK